MPFVEILLLQFYGCFVLPVLLCCLAKMPFCLCKRFCFCKNAIYNRHLKYNNTSFFSSRMKKNPIGCRAKKSLNFYLINYIYIYIYLYIYSYQNSPALTFVIPQFRHVKTNSSLTQFFVIYSKLFRISSVCLTLICQTKGTVSRDTSSMFVGCNMYVDHSQGSLFCFKFLPFSLK